MRIMITILDIIKEALMMFITAIATMTLIAILYVVGPITAVAVAHIIQYVGAVWMVVSLLVLVAYGLYHACCSVVRWLTLAPRDSD